MQTQHGSRSYAVHSKTSGNLPCPQLKHHAMSRDSEVWRFRRLFNSPSGELPGISPISSLERVTWQLQVDQKTKAKGRRQRGSDPDLEIDQGEQTRWRNCGFFFVLKNQDQSTRESARTAKERHQRWQGMVFFRTSKGSLAVLRQKRIRLTLFGQYNGNLCPARCLSVSYWLTD